MLHKENKKTLIKRKSLFLFLLITILSISTFSPIVNIASAQDATKKAQFEEVSNTRIEKLLLTSSFAWCIAQNANSDILLDNAVNDFDNFADSVENTRPGVYLANQYGIDKNGTVDCGSSSYKSAVLSALGNITKIEFFCKSGARYKPANSTTDYTGDDCIKYANAAVTASAANGKDPVGKFDWDAPSGKVSGEEFAKGFWKYVYGGNDPRLSQGAESYIFYRNITAKSCIPLVASDRPTEPISGMPSGEQYYGVKWVDINNTSGIVSGWYEGAKKQNDWVVIEPWEKLRDYGQYHAEVDSYGDNQTSEKCKDIVAWMSDNANGYLSEWKSFVDDKYDGDAAAAAAAQENGANGPDKTGGKSSCTIPGVGWIVCPVVKFGAWIADGSFKLLSDNFLKTSTTIFTGTITNSTGENVNPTFEAWSAMRSIANVAFVIVFLIIIFSQVTSVGISNYGIKKLLPRIIIAAILVNLSFYICQIAVDLSNILGYSLKSFLSDLAPKSFESSSGYIFSGNNLWGDTAGTIIAAGTAIAVWGSLAVLMPAMLAAIIALVMILFILVTRQALIILLIVISPLAFVAFLLPNTNDWFKKWQKAFTSMLMLFPIIAVVFGASTFASTVLSQVFSASDATMGKIVSAFVLVVPLFVVPGLLKKSLDGVGSIGTKMNGLSDKWGKGAGDAYKGSAFNKYNEGIAADKKARISSGNYRGAGGNFNPNNWRSGANRRLNKSGTFNTVTGGFGAHRDLTSQSQDRKDSQEAMSMFGGDDVLMSAWARTGGDASKLGAGELNDARMGQFNRLRQAGHQNKATSHLSAAQALSESGKGDANLIMSALGHAKAAGADNIEISGAQESAIASYRKSGRGDALADLSTAIGRPMDQEKGWSQVAPENVNREGIAAGSAGEASYINYLKSDKDNVRAALAGYDKMEQRAKIIAKDHIIAASQSFNPSVTNIQDAKNAHGVK